MKKNLCINRLNCFLFFGVSFCLMVSCSNSTQQNTTDTKKNIPTDSIHQKPASSFSDTVTIGFPAAVFYNPDSLQLLKIKAATDTMIFGSIMHEYEYQMKYSRKVLKKQYPKIKIISVMNARYIQFNKADGKKEIIDLNNNNNTCGLYLFNVKNVPLPADMMNIESALYFYFSK